jgi:hypothetical protein
LLLSPIYSIPCTRYSHPEFSLASELLSLTVQWAKVFVWQQVA